MAGPAGSIDVLHIDDDPEFADLAAEVLEREDDRFAVASATSGDRGLELVAERSFDCLVVDYDMPGLNGIEVLEAVRADHPDVPVIVFTGKGSEAVASEAISAGVTDYLQKGPGTERLAALADRIRAAVFGPHGGDLRQVKEEYETVFNTVQDAVFLFDVTRTDDGYEFRLRRLNPVHEALTGLSSAADRGKTPRELLGEAAGAEVEANYRRCVEAREPIAYEESLEMPAGTIDWQTKLGPVVRDGEVAQIVGVARDVRQQKARERELERYRTLVEAVGDPMYILDAAGTIEMANEAMIRSLGAERRAVEGSPISEFMTAESFERGTELIRDIRDDPDRDSGTFEMTAVTPDGERIPAETNLAVLRGDDGAYRGSVGVVRDISDRQAREQELRRQNERLDEFTSVVSHDLRNPLTVAKGRLELAAEECDSEQLDLVGAALDRMETLIDDMLALTRAGETVGDTESVELAAVAESCWQHVETGSAALVADASDSIEADRTRLQQLLENLFVNAVQHGEGEVVITVGDLETGFFVEDDGPGIPAAEREAVFEPGYTTTDDGTGFGLSIVADIADAHGWDTAVTEGTDGGTRFEFTGVAGG